MSRSPWSLLSAAVLSPNPFQTMDLENTNNNHVAHKDTTSLVFIVLNVMPQNIGMPSTKDVLPVMLVTFGMLMSTNAPVVNSQDKLSEVTVSAHHQKLSGMPPQKPAHVHQTLSVTTVFHAQPQESGTTDLTLVNAQPQQLSGTDNNVSAQLEDMDHHVLNAQPQDTGMLPPTNVSVKDHSSGTDKTVFAQLDISCIKEDVPDVQMDILGKTTNVKLAHALIRIWKSSELESDTFIDLWLKYIHFFQLTKKILLQ